MGLLLGVALGNRTGADSEPCSLTQQQLFPRNTCSPPHRCQSNLWGEGALPLVRKVVSKEAVGSQVTEMGR